MRINALLTDDQDIITAFPNQSKIIAQPSVDNRSLPFSTFRRDACSLPISVPTELRLLILAYLTLRDLSVCTRLTKELYVRREHAFSLYVKADRLALSDILCRIYRREILNDNKIIYLPVTVSNFSLPLIAQGATHLDLSLFDLRLRFSKHQKDKKLPARILGHLQNVCPNAKSFATGCEFFCEEALEAENLQQLPKLSKLVLQNVETSALLASLERFTHLSWLEIDSPRVQKRSSLS